MEREGIVAAWNVYGALTIGRGLSLSVEEKMSHLRGINAGEVLSAGVLYGVEASSSNTLGCGKALAAPDPARERTFS